ncbi:MAG: glucuronate isomerase [Defluviitaleaceae bacterium]|nr:glucuronate isomerase [Defluviitaleaceae bacterium]MCL2836201.1 glucuronate isomerase [Defluviitaleaceae bacterium]
MKPFLSDDFLLDNELAIKLYNEIKGLPILDYHCHLDPAEIAEDKRFKNLTEIWLGGDHYKWRLMRANGVCEEYITGEADDCDKFYKWAETVEDLIGSPLYHWTHLELRRYFGYMGCLSAKTAKEVWEHCNSVIQGADFSVWKILERFNVEVLCTTDDPADDLRYHISLAKSGLKTKVLPTFRPSKAMAVDSPGFPAYTGKLAEVSGVSISDYETLRAALYKRIEFFHEAGCRVSDNALDPPVFEDYEDSEINYICIKALNGELLENVEINKLKTALFVDMGRKYAGLGWAMQLHLNAARSNNRLMYEKLGPDTGYDSILDVPVAVSVNKLLDSLAKTDSLPKTILYSLNPADDDVIGTLTGNFQGGGVRGKIQFGSAWWFNDTKSGMEKQMTVLANTGMLARFIGMLTDSRSFLSYTRHEYFRRIMVNLIAGFAWRGEFPGDFNKLAAIARNISYGNAKEYFSF